MFLSPLLQAAKWLIILFIFWLLILGYQIATFPVGNLEDSADGAIVLGASVVADKPSPVFAERIKHATNLYHVGRIKKIIFTGGFGENKTNAESVVAQRYAITQRVAAKDILIETQSNTTRENLLEAKK